MSYFIIGTICLCVGIFVGAAIDRNNEELSDKVADKLTPWWKKIFK